MDLNPQQIVFQLGIAGLIVWVGYRLAMRAIDRWSEIEKEKTAAVREGFTNITTSVNAHSSVDIASHVALAESHGEVREAVVRLEGKVDATLDWQDRTPVEGTRATSTGIPRTTPMGLYHKRPGSKDER